MAEVCSRDKNESKSHNNTKWIKVRRKRKKKKTGGGKKNDRWIETTSARKNKKTDRLNVCGKITRVLMPSERKKTECKMSLKNGDIIRNVLYGCFAASKNVISKWTDQRKQEYIKTFWNFTNYKKKWSEEKMNEKTKNTLKILTTLGVFFLLKFQYE